MAQGPMSVGAQAAIKFITDKTLTQEDIAADAKVVGEKLAKKFDAAGGTLGGNLSFPAIGDTDVSKKIIWSGSTDGAEIYYQTIGADHGRLVINLKDDDNCELVIAQNGAVRSYFSPADGKFHGAVVGNADTATYAQNADTVDNVHFKHNNLGVGAGENDELLIYSGVIINDDVPVRTVNYRTLANIYSHTMATFSKTAGGSAYGGKGCVRFQNGLQVCWGEGTKEGYIAFEQPFVDTSYTVMLTPMRDVLHDYYVSGKNAAGFNMKQNGSSSTATTTYFAYGWWKEPVTLDW